MSEWQDRIRCATRQRLSYSAAVLTETIARHRSRAVRRGAFTLRSQDATAVASSRRGKVKGGIACSAPVPPKRRPRHHWRPPPWALWGEDSESGRRGACERRGGCTPGPGASALWRRCVWWGVLITAWRRYRQCTPLRVVNTGGGGHVRGEPALPPARGRWPYGSGA